MKERLTRFAAYALGMALIVRRERPGVASVTRDMVEIPVHTEPAPEPPPAKTSPEATGPSHPEARPQPGILGHVKSTIQSFMDDDCMTLGAAIAYYTIFSLAPLLLTVISLAGLIFGRQAVQHDIQQQIQGLIGADAAKQVETMLQHQAEHQAGGIIGSVVGIVVLIFGATGAFAAIQDALNKVWHVKPDPAAGGVKTFLTKRVLSFGMLLGIVFLLIVSLAVSAALAAVGGWIGQMLPAALSGGLLQAAGVIASLAVITVLFAAMFKVLPDGEVAWRDVWIGAAVTSVLFTAGKTGLGIYLGKSATASAYGAAGSLVLLVLWLYYASLIVLLGAEFTKIWAAGRGRAIAPESGAVRVVTQEKHERPQQAA